jgi:hypothetical protein
MERSKLLCFTEHIKLDPDVIEMGLDDTCRAVKENNEGK